MENGIDRELQQEFEQKIGYSFENVKLLEQALTHSSYANECFWCKHQDNERLEFLGDAVLEIAVSEYLYHKYPKRLEGELTRTRASIVCESTLALCTRDLQLGKYLLLGKGEEQTGGRERSSILSDALEAVIGAVYLDGGFASAKELVTRVVLNDIEHKHTFEFREGKVTVFFEDILYVESNLHKLIFHMAGNLDRKYTMYEKLDSIEELLHDAGFCRIHKSCLVNLRYVEHVERYKAGLQNGSSLAISKSRYIHTRDEWICYRGEI